MTLSDVCTKISDCPHSTAVDEGKGHPLLRTPNIGKGVLLLDGVHRVSDAVYKQRTARAVPEKGDLVLAREAPAGNVAIIDTDERVCLGQRTVLLKVDKEKADPRFLAYYLLSPKSQYALLGTANGATVAHVNMSTIARVPVELPSLEEQKEVAQILEVIDSKIGCNKRINDNLLNQVRIIFDNWFSSFSHFDGARPKDWKMGTINDLAESIVCGKTPSTKNKSYYGNEIPFVTIPDMHNSTYIVKTERYLSKLGGDSQYNKYLPPNSICVSCIGTAGLVSFVHTTSQTNQQINSIIPKKNISPYYVFLLMEKLSQKIQSLGSSGSTIVNLNKEQFSQIEV